MLTLPIIAYALLLLLINPAYAAERVDTTMLEVSVWQGQHHDTNGPDTERYSTHSRERQQRTSQIRVLNGQQAFIRLVQSIPVVQQSQTNLGSSVQQTTDISFKDLITGFWVLPKIQGDKVIVIIHEQRGKEDREGGGKLLQKDTETTIAIPFNQWQPISGHWEKKDKNADVYSTQLRHESMNATVYIKVQKIR